MSNFLKNKILAHNTADFNHLALAVFQYQAKENPVYNAYLNLLKCDPAQVSQLTDIPFLPISLFKTHTVLTGPHTPGITFSSSGTTGQQTSLHQVVDPDFYTENALKGFAQFYGPVKEYCVLALLPAYLERTGSSLVFMVQQFIQQSIYPTSGFYLDDLEALAHQLKIQQAKKIPTLLIGVSFALMDLAEQFPQDLSNIIIMETGGMKGRRKEITRKELHTHLKIAFQIANIHSEYGMTELLSQAYSQGDEWFDGGATLRVLVREINDPFAYVPAGRTGVLNVVDLANVNSCSFVATADLGQVGEDQRFKVLGRLDASDVRGCNLMVDG